MRRLMVAAVLCAAPMLAFATAASAAGDYPPDDSEVEAETEQICAAAADAAENTDPGGGNPDDGDPGGGTITGKAGNSGDPGEGDPGSDDEATGTAGGAECSEDTSTGTDEQVASGIATENPGSGSAATADVGGSLPETGTDASMILRIAAMSVVAGGALIAVAWWRKRPSLA